MCAFVWVLVSSLYFRMTEWQEFDIWFLRFGFGISAFQPNNKWIEKRVFLFRQSLSSNVYVSVSKWNTIKFIGSGPQGHGKNPARAATENRFIFCIALEDLWVWRKPAPVTCDVYIKSISMKSPNLWYNFKAFGRYKLLKSNLNNNFLKMNENL